MEHFEGYDEYEKDFKNLALPEFQWMAEQMLLEAIDSCGVSESLQVILPESMSKDDEAYIFKFMEQSSCEIESCGLLLLYMGCY